jgi:YD repeat-containing protein
MQTFETVERYAGWMATIVWLAATVACGGTTTSSAQPTGDDGAREDSNGKWMASDSERTSSRKETRDETDGAPSPGADAPSPDSEPLDACAPRPRRVELDDVPTLPEPLRNVECPEFEIASSGRSERSNSHVVWKRRGHRFVRLFFENDRQMAKTVFELDESGTVRRIERRDAVRPDEEGGVQKTWVFDREGRLEKKVHLTRYRREGDGWDVYSRSETRQTWKEGRLVERVVELRTNSGTETTRRTWSYDDRGRPTTGRVETDEGTYGLHWSYGEEGPTRVEHRVDGETIAVRTWSYRDDGHLEKRRVRIQPQDRTLSDVRRWLNRSVFERYDLALHRRSPYVYQPRPMHSRPESGSACRTLPHAVGFGYPTDRSAYRLVWDDVGALEQVRDLPYLNGRRYHYGALPYYEGMWFGHRGAVSRAPGASALLASEGGTVEIHYDERGRMTEQTVRTDGEVVQRRTRSLGTHGVEVDRLEGASDDPSARTLRFERNSQGRMVRRSLLRGDDTIGYQTFDHAEAGWIEEVRFVLPRVSTPIADYPDDVAPSQLRHVATYRRQLDEQGRPLRFAREYLADSHTLVARSRVTTYAYGPHGLVDRSTSSLEAPDDVLHGLRKTYDASGRVERTFTVEDDVVQRIERWRRAEDGRLLSHREGKPEGSGRLRTHSYRCGESRSGE